MRVATIVHCEMERSEWRLRPPALERSAASATAALTTAATSLQSRIRLLLDGRVGELPPDQRCLLEVAGHDADRLVELLADLRLVALAGGEQRQLEWARVDLTAAVCDAVELVWPRAFPRGKKLTLSAAEPVWVTADPARIARALLRLLREAVDAAPIGSVIAVDVGTDGEVAVTYEADGEPALDSLGLALVEAIAAAHGGTLDCRYKGPTVRLAMTIESAAAATPLVSVA